MIVFITSKVLSSLYCAKFYKSIIKQLILYSYSWRLWSNGMMQDCGSCEAGSIPASRPLPFLLEKEKLFSKEKLIKCCAKGETK